MLKLYLELYAWKIKKFTIGFHRTCSDSIDFELGYWCVVIYYRPESDKGRI
jgi:hypothetical protein